MAHTKLLYHLRSRGGEDSCPESSLDLCQSSDISLDPFGDVCDSQPAIMSSVMSSKPIVSVCVTYAGTLLSASKGAPTLSDSHQAEYTRATVRGRSCRLIRVRGDPGKDG